MTEVSKLQSHLNLLREEYVKLQNKYTSLEKNYQVLLASSGQVDEDNFISRLLKTVAELFDKELYSDLIVKLKEQTVRGHKFVLAARSDTWGVKNFTDAAELDLTDIPNEVGKALLRWVYTDEVAFQPNDTFLLDLLKVARRFDLTPLARRCEESLVSSVNVRNCIRYYQSAEEIGADILKEHCSELISKYWNDFTSEDFASMPASLAYRMFKTKTEFPLHTAIRVKREDVVFLYLVEHDSQLPGKLNEIDSQGDLPLDLSLREKLEGIADTLVKHKVDVNKTDHSGLCLLHKAIKRGDEFAAGFLIEHMCDVNATTHLNKETALHLVAAYNPNSTSQTTMTGIANVTGKLLKHDANPDNQDLSGNTPLHTAVLSKNEAVLSILLQQKNLNLELANCEGHTVLAIALQSMTPDDQYTEDCFAGLLIKRGSSPNANNKETGDSLLHSTARAKNEAAALFLASHGANCNFANKKGENPLHIACQNGLAKLAEVLLGFDANPNAQTTAPAQEDGVYKQTPLHLAIDNEHKPVVQVFLNHKAKVSQEGNNLKIIPNFTIKDSEEQTALGLALWHGLHDIALELLTGGADVNHRNTDGLTLLQQAILKQDTASCLFLMENQADCNARTADNETCLQLAIKRHLPSVVETLCVKGANMNMWNERWECPLWEALETGQEDVASVLVRHGCDTDMWGAGPDDCQQTLLHKAIDENNESVACFLIRSLCDINSPRRPGINGEGGEEARDGKGPAHLAAEWGQDQVMQCLLEHNVDINAQDDMGKTPLHFGIENQHQLIISLLMSHPRLDLTVHDKQGLTAFASAMMTRNNKAAQSILNREPTAAEQFDIRGRNFLHVAIQNSDIESVLFLIGVNVNVNSRLRDSSQLTPLHLAVRTGSEIIVRHLLLAGANINDLTIQKQTSLHLAAEKDHAGICSVLLQNNITYDAVDDAQRNGLHVAVQHGHLATVRVLLSESAINAEAVNMKGQNPLHVLGQHGRENAAAIFELFLETMPEYPIDKPDPNGSTVLLLAYMNGNGNLCRAIVRAGARLGTVNRDGISVFNCAVATRQLLFKLLDMLSQEPPWCEGENCLQCGVKFGIKTRKHHCRHCGRLLCSKCSHQDMPILKYNITKPVRVCEMCFDVLTLGMAGMS